ncbi:hypothetical protein SDC9_121898 [bioreactor metagenome]|uniref:Uncharacterized protein n=1 Tax=bioreactor metagenome TaxID=1076179 RepID=A0A645CD81_9ZZZZ
MLPSYLAAPKGSETGLYLTQDFGGANVRISLVELHGGGRFSDYALNKDIAIDGSLFEKLPGYAAVIRETISIFDRRLADKTAISLVKDGSGSGVGAAIAAAMASK